MSSALAALANGVATTIATASANGVAASATSTLQLLVPATSWNWPTDANGTSSASLYDFCSWEPVHGTPAQPFAASATRFADAYQTFLQYLQPDTQTTAAQSRFTNAAYYTTVLYAQGTQPSLPAWNVSQFPQAWLASVAGSTATAGTIHVPLPAQGESPSPGTATCFGIATPAGTATALPLSAGAGQWIDIHADAWGQITLRPGGWYNGALLALKAAGPYLPGTNPALFFGPEGVLSTLLTGICVALNPSITASITTDFAAHLGQTRQPGSTLRVGGIHFASFSTTRTGSTGSAQLTATGTDTAPVIIGATTTTLGNGP